KAARRRDRRKHRCKQGLSRGGGPRAKAHVPAEDRPRDRRRVRRNRIMALLQISEPGQSPAPHEHRLAVGIDLGTTNSLVATVRSGVATVLPDAHGRALLPSIVRYFADGRAEVGYGAQARQADDPINTVVSVKRYMGRGVEGVALIESAPYDF